MDFVFQYKHGCPLGRIGMVGEANGAQVPPIKGMRKLGQYALIYLFGGSGTYSDTRGVRRDLTGGDAFLIFPELAHHYGPVSNKRDWNEYYIVFEGPVFDLWRRESLLLEGDQFFRLEPVYMWLKRFREVVDQHAIPSPLSSLADISRLQLLLADILGYRAHALLGDDESAWLQRAYSLIETGLTARPDFQADARQLGVSYDVFRRRFAKLAGHSPMDYRQIRLVDRASALLCSTRKTNAEIAAELHICDEFHFSRMFKKITRESPGAFRNRFLASGVN